jgi:hypothetical protein
MSSFDVDRCFWEGEVAVLVLERSLCFEDDAHGRSSAVWCNYRTLDPVAGILHSLDYLYKPWQLSSLLVQPSGWLYP